MHHHPVDTIRLRSNPFIHQMQCSSQLTTSTAPSILSSHYDLPHDICKLIDEYADKRVAVKYYHRVYSPLYYKPVWSYRKFNLGRPPVKTIETGLFCGYIVSRARSVHA